MKISGVLTKMPDSSEDLGKRSEYSGSQVREDSEYIYSASGATLLTTNQNQRQSGADITISCLPMDDRCGQWTIQGILKDGWNSLVRYYLNNFCDGTKQDTIDLLQGHYIVSISQDMTPASQKGGLEAFARTQENVLGEGGYGVVYRGHLINGTPVAIKKLLNNLGQAEKEFRVEVEAIGHVRHKNLVRLLVYCIEGMHRMLVYEYVNNGNLELGDYCARPSFRGCCNNLSLQLIPFQSLSKNAKSTINVEFSVADEEKIRGERDTVTMAGEGIFRKTVAALLTLQEITRDSSTYSHFSLPPLKLPDSNLIQSLQLYFTHTHSIIVKEL
ncbi:hypothetical protein F0562_020224 [Nyssa sinensis]|uniref:non-specific serine/threonine protein kinase n=1 Tax=Nyssa sinensis TaxID=561372 RepID=A0A5J5BTL5_9ASTE|nr:hypothetical protein F0562_020224 [Nyssa sinensis]